MDLFLLDPVRQYVRNAVDDELIRSTHAPLPTYPGMFIELTDGNTYSSRHFKCRLWIVFGDIVLNVR